MKKFTFIILLALSTSVMAQTYTENVSGLNSNSRFAVLDKDDLKATENSSLKSAKSYKNSAKYYTGLSHRPYTFSSNLPNKFYSFAEHASGESIKSSHWTEITNVSKVIEMKSEKNEIHLTLSGSYQVNNKEKLTEPIFSTVGFFIDDKLVDVKPLFLDASSTCASNLFTINTTLHNLSKGQHSIKFALRNIETPTTAGLTLTYGGSPRATNCKLISAPTIPLKASILVNEL